MKSVLAQDATTATASSILSSHWIARPNCSSANHVNNQLYDRKNGLWRSNPQLLVHSKHAEIKLVYFILSNCAYDDQFDELKLLNDDIEPTTRQLEDVFSTFPAFQLNIFDCSRSSSETAEGGVAGRQSRRFVGIQCEKIGPYFICAGAVPIVAPLVMEPYKQYAVSVGLATAVEDFDLTSIPFRLQIATDDEIAAQQDLICRPVSRREEWNAFSVLHAMLTSN